MYSFLGRVRYSETDTRGKLSIPAIINYFQDCSNFHSDELGIGIDYLMGKGCAWVLIAWNVIFEKELAIGDKLKVSTLSRQINKFYAYRQFLLEDENSNVCAKADTMWIYIDLATRRPLKMPQNEIDLYGEEEGFGIEPANRKMILPPVTGVGETLKIKKMHLDTNNHVNNAHHIAIAMEYLPEDFNLGNMKVVYEKEITLGETVIPHIHEAGDSIYVSLRGLDERVFSSIQFTKKEKDK